MPHLSQLIQAWLSKARPFQASPCKHHLLCPPSHGCSWRARTRVIIVGIKGHAVAEAVAEAPKSVARAFLYIVRAFPSFLLHPLYKTFYHIFHQVMSPDCRAYLLKKHSIVLYTPTIVYLVQLQVCRPQKTE